MSPSPRSGDQSFEKPAGSEPSDGPASPTNPPTWSYRIRLMLALALPVFMETLDYTVVATAQPHIASHFNRLDLQSYIGTAYVLTSTVFLPIFASFSDIFGRYWALQLSVVIFAIGSALSTAAQNMPMMLAGRGIAGIGAAGQLTVVRVILADSRSLDDNNFQASILVFLYAIGFSTGPAIGGALTGINFRWVFAINLPCCVVSIILCFIFLRGVAKPPQPRRALSGAATRKDVSAIAAAAPQHESILEKILRVDTIGAVLFIAGGILILLGLNWGSTSDWSQSRVIATIVIGALCFVGFVLWEWFVERGGIENEAWEFAEGQSHWQTNEKRISWTRPEAMVPLAVFKNYDVCATQFAALSAGMVMLGMGTIFSIQAIKWLRQPKIPIVIGTFIVPIALGLLSHAMKSNKEGLVDGFLVMAGFGIGLTFGPLAIHARFSQPEDRVAVVVALNLFFRTFGGTVGLAQCSAVLNAKVRHYITRLITSGTLSPDDLSKLARLGGIGSIDAISQLPPELAQSVRNAFREGVRWAFISLVPWTGLAAVLVLFLSNIHDTDLERPRATSSSDNQATDSFLPSSGGGGGAGGASTGRGRPFGERKPPVYRPVSLLIYYVRKGLAERRAAGVERRTTAVEEATA